MSKFEISFILEVCKSTELNAFVLQLIGFYSYLYVKVPKYV